MRRGGGRRSPRGGGGVPRASLWGVWGWALSLPQQSVLRACGRGPLPFFCGHRGLRASGPVTKPTAHALASWRCPLWKRGEGSRGGGVPFASLTAVLGWAVSLPPPPVLGARGRGPLPVFLGRREMRAWGPVTDPTAHDLGNWCCTLWGRHEGIRGGASRLFQGCPGMRTLPPLTARPWGKPPGPAACFPWARGIRA